MQQQERRAEDVADTNTSSARYVMDQVEPGGAQTAGAPSDLFDVPGPASSSYEPSEVPDIAPEQVAVVCDAPTLADAVARECLQTLDLLQATMSGRVLLVEPFAETAGRLLREGGFQGQRVALLSPISHTGPLGHRPARGQITSLEALADQTVAPHEQPMTARRNIAAGFDRAVVNDWLSAVHEQRFPEIPQDQRFQVIVIQQLSRMFSPDDWLAALHWLKNLLVPEGFLIIGEPSSWIDQRALEAELHTAGFLLAADTRRIETDWSWRILRWQHRPGDFGRLPGTLVRVRRSDLDTRHGLRQAVVASYREVFGGDEWGEWMWCSVCPRQYSRREYEELDPADQCVCGAERSLEVMHPPEHVLAEVRRDLADSDRSRLYVCIGQSREVEAFIWGYITTARRIAEILLPRQGEDERQLFIQRLLDRLARLGVANPESAPIYHQAYIGSVKQVRSFSLPRALFARMCQFALDQDVRLAVTATIPSVNAYALLRGIGMDVVYTYPPLSPESRLRDRQAERGFEITEAPPNVPAPAISQPSEAATTPHDGHDSDDGDVVMPYSRLDESGVIVAGSVHDVLSLLMSKSDRGLAKAVGVFLRQQRDGAPASSVAAADDRVK
ncbi:MAG TPA: hypothetical protein VKQ30_06475 [Ktedonobacterales bacterium]|nr:hypothetical protein [Ktedonobacterales bacterium]